MIFIEEVGESPDLFYAAVQNVLGVEFPGMVTGAANASDATAVETVAHAPAMFSLALTLPSNGGQGHQGIPFIFLKPKKKVRPPAFPPVVLVLVPRATRDPPPTHHPTINITPRKRKRKKGASFLPPSSSDWIPSLPSDSIWRRGDGGVEILTGLPALHPPPSAASSLPTAATPTGDARRALNQRLWRPCHWPRRKSVFEDKFLVRVFLEVKGQGRVLVVDGGGSLRCAILGGNTVQQAQNNGWAGIVVNGCIRDVDEINRCDIGVRALNSHPMKANKKGMGEARPHHHRGHRICDGSGSTPTPMASWSPGPS
ncbi:hypothetical protein ZWY2020_000015 [Hordeum vulgare]|nr:hypothetical protein ZWY2020_000015 [Hordeum vulgare]